ncbi:phospholipase D-like domain-containing protein [Evansella clarkii]|uniref:phospholipase D-like domain-containing protein n=1 Tax=Evansella clarkii TaxID=79879 RepID=UPI000B43607C|nr:phospholipase D family protein [Evansella clarkii]
MIALVIILYAVYAFITAVVMFQIAGYEKESYPAEERDIERFYGEEESVDRVALIEGRLESKAARNNIRESAQETLDITNFKLNEGSAAEMFFASVVEAADRGVKVRILFDGIFHSLRGEQTDIVYAMAAHPNIQLKFYEPVDLLRPWTLNNRLHDKLVIADDNLAMISGRNIGDRYFAPEGYDNATNDRDAVVYNTEDASFGDSVIYEVKDYFEYVWNHEFSHDTSEDLSERQLEEGEERLAEFREQLEFFHEEYAEFFRQELDWEGMSHPTRNVTFIHNPIERMNKDPWVWKDITALMESAEDYIFMQSPFIIPSDKVMEHLNTDNITAGQVDILTNSLAASPNETAWSGWYGHREEMAASMADVYEYQGPVDSIHGKSFLIDDRISIIGSFNLDPRSVYLSTESMFVVDSEEVNEELRNYVEEMMQYESLKVADDGSYVPNENVEEEDVPTSKYLNMWFQSLITRFFEHML